MRFKKDFSELYNGIANLFDGAIGLNAIDIGHFDIIPLTKSVVKWASEAANSVEEQQKLFEELMGGLNSNDTLAVLPFSVVSEPVSTVLGDDSKDISEEFEACLRVKANESLDRYDNDYEAYLCGGMKSSEIHYCVISDNEASFFLNAIDAKSGELFFKIVFYMRRADWSCVDLKDFAKIVIDTIASFLSEENVVVETNIL